MNTFNDRIIAGSLKGRVICLPDDDGVRPTKNRVRQAVFSMLGSRLDWDNLSVVDLCCGSGAWGLEAFSRGAATVWLVDTSTKTAEQNVRALAVRDAVHVVKSNVLGWAPPAPLDVILADPPYGTPIAQQLIARAALLGRSGSWWCVETGTMDKDLDWTGFAEVEYRDYGRSRIWLARQV